MWIVMWMWAALAGPAPVGALDSVVLIRQGHSTCGGVLLDGEGTIATAYHCVAPGGRPRVTTRAGTTTRGRVVRVLKWMDLALLRVPELAGAEWLPLVETPPSIGGSVWAIGHPGGGGVPGGFLEGTLRWSLSEGIVSTVGVRALQVTAPVNRGNSGGPVVDVEGNVVGIVSRRMAGEGLSFAARAQGIRQLVEGEGRTPGPLGGTISLLVGGSMLDSGGGAVALGGRLELSFRDRIVMGVGASEAPLGRWTTLRYGPTSWTRAEARIGVRQRAELGPFPFHAEIHGGVIALTTCEVVDDSHFRTHSTAAPLIGAAVRFWGVDFELGLIPTPDGRWHQRYQIVLRWPGKRWVF